MLFPIIFSAFLGFQLVQQSAAATYTTEALADQIHNLPGAEGLNVTFNQFSGYLSIDGASPGSKKMHYWLVESMNDPENDPISFWTNGGPGCSGMIGFMTEMGPFRPNEDKTLSFNEYAWNQVSNMVFIESPSGVGFSYSEDEADNNRKIDDVQTAQDNYFLIQEFMKRFPEYSSRDMYLTSESYGGHYLPTLAKVIVDENAAGVHPSLPFKGFAVGNPFTGWYSAIPAHIETFWGHQKIPKPLYDEFKEKCNTDRPNDLQPNPDLKRCIQLQLQMFDLVGNLNGYALDYPVCLSDDNPAKAGRSQRAWLNAHMTGRQIVKVAHNKSKSDTPYAVSSTHYNNPAAIAVESSSSYDAQQYVYEPCEGDFTNAYLNDPLVKTAIHVKSDIEWEDCSISLKYKYSDSFTSTAPIYNYLIDGGYGLNILVFSGDDDSVCSTIGTQQWIWDLGYEVDSDRRWEQYVVDGQTAGYFTQWKDTKLGFLTIHGAGHEVPAYKPEVALDMFARYLKGEWTSA